MRTPARVAAVALAALALCLVSPARSADTKDSGASPQMVKPLRVLLVLGGCCHDYANQKDILAKGLAARANVQCTIAYDPRTDKDKLNPVYEKADWAKGFDVVVHDECTSGVVDLKTIDRILEPHKNGLPGVVLHCGMHSYRSEGWPKSTPWFEYTGLVTTGHGPKLPIAVRYTDKQSPIVKGMEDWTTINEEHYNNAAGKLNDTAHELARGKQTIPAHKTKKQETPQVTNDFVVVWTNEYGDKKARVFATTIGHFNETVADPRYLDLVTRGLLWACGKLDENGQPLPGYGPKGK